MERPSRNRGKDEAEEDYSLIYTRLFPRYRIPAQLSCTRLSTTPPCCCFHSSVTSVSSPQGIAYKAIGNPDHQYLAWFLDPVGSTALERVRSGNINAMTRTAMTRTAMTRGRAALQVVW